LGLPTRLFHWLLAFGFLTAFGIAKWVGDDSPVFSVHMLLGLVIGPMVAIRILWGFAGSQYARFRSFLFGPGEVLAYLQGTLTSKGKRYTGYNPGLSYAIYAMLLLLLGIVLTGLLRRGGNKVFEELRELLVTAMIIVVAVHVLGVVAHIVTHWENIVRSMLDGTKEGTAEDGIRSSHSVVGFVFLLLVMLWAGGLFRSFDPSSRQTVLPIVGVTVGLGEDEEQEDDEHHGEDD